MQRRRVRKCVILAWVFVAGLAVAPRAFGDDHVRGVITGRGNATMTVRADDTSLLTVAFTETTKIRRTEGARQFPADAATLIPGLRVRLEGSFEGADRFIAQRITFTREDLKTALDIHGGVNPTDRRSLENEKRIEQNARAIDQNARTIGQHQQSLSQQATDIAGANDRIRANEDKLVATTGALDATNARIANLDNYNVVSTMTVYFGNGRVTVPSKYKNQLQQFAAQARATTGYVIQVQGYASDVGPAPLNQRLSALRADTIAAMLQQNGIPPTNMLPPAAMGVSEQVAANKTAKGQAENRRVVVTVLQNKGITGQ